MIKDGEDLGAEAYNAMRQLLDDKTSEKDIYDFLIAMNERIKKKPISAFELSCFVAGMKKDAPLIEKPEGDVTDICGTGGTGLKTINVSTLAGIIAACAGIKVMKHGNRSNSGYGSADILEAVGYNIEMDPSHYKGLADKTNFVFLYSQKCYPTMAKAAKVRKEIGERTIFNSVGPLPNPANANYRLIGVNDDSLCEIYCDALINLGVDKAMIVHGIGGMDEVSVVGETKFYILEGKIMKGPCFTAPDELGLRMHRISDIIINSPEESIDYFNRVLDGEEGPMKDWVLANAGMAIFLFNDGITPDAGVEKARDIIDSGKARAKLEEVIQESNKYK